MMDKENPWQDGEQRGMVATSLPLPAMSQFPRPRMQEIGGDGSDVGAPGARVTTATAMDGGICRCDECGEYLLEDERHLHSCL